MQTAAQFSTAAARAAAASMARPRLLRAAAGAAAEGAGADATGDGTAAVGAAACPAVGVTATPPLLLVIGVTATPPLPLLIDREGPRAAGDCCDCGDRDGARAAGDCGTAPVPVCKHKHATPFSTQKSSKQGFHVRSLCPKQMRRLRSSTDARTRCTAT